MLLYILIFGLAVIGSVLLLWYFDPLEPEGFSRITPKTNEELFREIYNIAVPTATPAAAPETTARATAVATKRPTNTASFWDLVDKIDKKQDPVKIAALARVTDPDPNDPNDRMPLTFSKYISIYALSQSTDPNWEVIRNEGNLGNDLRSVAGTVDQGKAACLSTPGCTEFASYQGTNYIKSIPPNAGKRSAVSGCTTYRLIGDISGARQALFSKYDEMQNGLSMNVYSRPPPGTDMKARSCANLDVARNAYTTKYNQAVAAAQDLSGTAIKAGTMRDENLAYQNTHLAACKGPTPSPACLSLASQEGPVFSLLAKYTAVNDAFASSGAIDLSNNLDVINTTYSLLGCTGTPLSFSQDLAYVIDTQTLLSKLNQMSPYYLSPDTLQYITSSIISSADTDASLMTDSDKLSNISKVIKNLKTLTGTS